MAGADSVEFFFVTVAAAPGIFVKNLGWTTHTAIKPWSRDKNGPETDGTKWCHICFHIFMRKHKQIKKHRKQI
jgi:hypothetical protein